MSKERATSNFPAVGLDGPSTENVSGQRSPSMQYLPRDKGGPTNPDVPGTGWGIHRMRRPVQVDAVTGQELTDRVNDRVATAARRAAEIIVPRPIDPAVHQAERRATHAAAVRAATDGLDHAGPVGAGLILRNPSEVLDHVFGLDR